MGCLADKGRSLITLRAVRKATDPKKAQQLVAGALPPLLASVLQPSELDSMSQRLRELPEPPEAVHLGKHEWMAALGVFLLVFLSTFPVAVPFMFIHKTSLAMRASNTVAIIMLLVAGVAYGRCVGRSPWKFGLAMVLLGGLLVALTIALGG
jgi:VIT1/CCC1 family predicted Fe2+/Mn2+ transporter